LESDISPADVENYYRNNSGEFVNPGAVRAAIIFLRGSGKMAPEKREELKQRAEMVLAEARRGKSDADFVRLAQRHSDDQATRYRGGELQWLTRQECDAALGSGIAATLFAMSEPSSFAPLAETSDGFYILKLRERREAQPRPRVEIEEIIRYRLLRERQFRREQEFFARMKQGLDIQINRPLVDSISIPTPEQNLPALPGAAQKLVNR
jgi:parvulin-like peptidyl-prolyl isomerase